MKKKGRPTQNAAFIQCNLKPDSMNKLAGVNVEQDNPVQLVSSQHLLLLDIQNTTPINYLEGNINRKCYEKMLWSILCYGFLT